MESGTVTVNVSATVSVLQLMELVADRSGERIEAIRDAKGNYLEPESTMYEQDITAGCTVKCTARLPGGGPKRRNEAGTSDERPQKRQDEHRTRGDVNKLEERMVQLTCRMGCGQALMTHESCHCGLILRCGDKAYFRDLVLDGEVHEIGNKLITRYA